jgi:hypothetical protein
VNYGPKIIKNGLVLALDAADKNSYIGSGTIWKDMSGNNNNATLINSPTFSSEKGGCIVFDGTNDYAQVEHTPLLSGFSQTISLWYKYSAMKQSILIVSKTDTGSLYNNGYIISQDDNAMYMSLRVLGTSYTISYNGGQLGIWYNLVLTFSSSATLRGYINGVLFGSISAPFLTSFTTEPLRIANSVSYVWPGYFNGAISNLLIYNRQLSNTEISQNYDTTKKRFGL